jgi:hypothetical protein
MSRFVAAALALVVTTPVLLLPATSRGSDRTLPMQFSLRLQGPGDVCAPNCRTLISASGAITADTPQDFKTFARDRDLTGAAVVLDSDGGSVHGAIALGREIRRLGLDTTVGRLADLDGAQRGTPRAKLIPRAECESMCAFVLVGGVHRTVPPDARVMVHQIWLGDRREDPTAANYSAEDLVLVQRDIGRLARYTADMGASIELLDLALRIPPWEPMHALTRAEIRRTRVETPAPDAAGATVAASPGTPAVSPLPRVTNGVGATAISEQRWVMIHRAGSAVLARRHPLTIEGEDIGSFDLMVACGADRDRYDVSYVERRHGGVRAPLQGKVGAVTLAAGRSVAKLKVVSSERRPRLGELVTYASGIVPTKLIGAFAGAGKHSMLITTRSAATATAIRLGNTGVRQNLPRLSAICGEGDRAALPLRVGHGLALANEVAIRPPARLCPRSGRRQTPPHRR